MSNSFDIYTAHFGLKERPFSLVPDPDYLYWSAGHRRALAILEYGVLTRAPITLITGEVGAGKTTLLQHVLKSIDRSVRIGLVANATGGRGELLRWVLQALDQPVSQQEGYVELFGRLQNFLISEYAAGRRVILIFDEAQNLSLEGLEELRMFTNINANKDELIQLVLVGQPELRDMVRQPSMSQFAQRIAAAFHLQAMDAAGVPLYIAHRLAVAGVSHEVFSPGAAALIHQRTGGVPRLVNQLCDLAMVYAYTMNSHKIDADLVQQVLDDGVFFADRGPAAEATTNTAAEAPAGETQAPPRAETEAR